MAPKSSPWLCCGFDGSASRFLEEEVLRSRFAVVFGGAGGVGATAPEDASLRLDGISEVAWISRGLHKVMVIVALEILLMTRNRIASIRRNNSAKGSRKR